MAALASVVLLALPALGLAALPKKGGVYQGTLHANSPTAVSKTIKLTVLASGLRARARFFCGSGRPSNLITFAVKKDGSFSGFSNTHLRLAPPVQAAARPRRPPSRDPRSLPRPRLLPRLLQKTPTVIVIRVLNAQTSESAIMTESPSTLIFAEASIERAWGAVGVVLTLINQLDVFVHGKETALTWVKVGLNFIVPFCVSNLGLLAGTSTPRDGSSE